jgi:hypothetical protein
MTADQEMKDWCMAAAKREGEHGDPECTVVPPPSSNQYCDCGTGDKAQFHAANCRIELVADQVGDFLYDVCGWRPTGDAQWQKIKAGIPALAKLLQLQVETPALGLPKDPVDLLVRAARDAGFSDTQWKAMFYESGPYDVTFPCFTTKKFIALLLERLQGSSEKTGAETSEISRFKCMYCRKPFATVVVLNQHEETCEASRDTRSPEQQAWCCWKCIPKGVIFTRMILCPDCGNKRCPKASDHELACTNSNAPGQPGSVYA